MPIDIYTSEDGFVKQSLAVEVRAVDVGPMLHEAFGQRFEFQTERNVQRDVAFRIDGIQPDR